MNEHSLTRHTGGVPRRCRSVGRKMFAPGSKAWDRRLKGDARRCRIRALRIAERQLRPHGFRVESVRKRALVPECVVDVAAVATRRLGLVSADDVVACNRAYTPMLWVGNTGTLMTRHGWRVDLAIHCRELTRAHCPECDCDDCFAVPF